MTNNIITKFCTVCKQEKTIEHFRKHNLGKHKVRGNCYKCELEYKKHYRQKNKEKIAASYKQWVANNSEKKNEINKRWMQKQFDENILFSIAFRIKTLINISIKSKGYKKGSKTEVILGCSYEYFKNHLEKQFLPNMGWNNRSEWHIDHIIPLATATNEEDVLKLNHFTNLRPLWAVDNLKKNSSRTHLI
jgi:hypothetical protein